MVQKKGRLGEVEGGHTGVDKNPTILFRHKQRHETHRSGLEVLGVRLLLVVLRLRERKGRN